jgi:hypothetical protein
VLVFRMNVGCPSQVSVTDVSLLEAGAVGAGGIVGGVLLSGAAVGGTGTGVLETTGGVGGRGGGATGWDVGGTRVGVGAAVAQPAARALTRMRAMSNRNERFRILTSYQ